jgi:hypothetical protein
LNFDFAKLLDALWHHESKRMIGHKSIGCPTQKKSYCWKEFVCFSRSTKKQQVYMHTVFWSSLLKLSPDLSPAMLSSCASPQGPSLLGTKALSGSSGLQARRFDFMENIQINE